MLSEFLGVIGAVVSGGATGLLGVIAQRVFDAWNKKQELDRLKAQWQHERGMKEIDAQIMREEWAQRTRVADIEAEGRKDVSANEAFAKSFELEPKSYSAGVKPPAGGKVAKFVHGLGWLMMIALDTVRGIVRPGLTLYLCVITTAMYETSRAALAVVGQDTDKVVLEVYKQIVFTVLYLFVTCVTWWFGTRNKQQPPQFTR